MTDFRDLYDARSDNNKGWIQIIYIALTHAPEETLEALKSIVEGDKRITNELEKIIKEHENNSRIGV